MGGPSPARCPTAAPAAASQDYPGPPAARMTNLMVQAGFQQVFGDELHEQNQGVR